MTTYVQVLEHIEKLQKQAATLRKKEVQAVIDRIKEAIAVYKLTPEELGFSEPAYGRSKHVRAPKYKDSAGNVWSGRGPRPKWFKKALDSGVDPESLRVR